ncbi:MAG TPA: DUF4238 domain-containing protein, partial [Lacipirellulaceae bacterium]
MTEYDHVPRARAEIGPYLNYYNLQRRHSSVGYLSPCQLESLKAAPILASSTVRQLPSISEYPERLTNDLLDRGRIGFDVDPFKGERMGYHYVPQEYLKGFADPSNPDRLWQFDKKVQIYSKAALPIDQIAQSRDFYDAKTEDELNRLVE